VQTDFGVFNMWVVKNVSWFFGPPYILNLWATLYSECDDNVRRRDVIFSARSICGCVTVNRRRAFSIITTKLSHSARRPTLSGFPPITDVVITDFVTLSNLSRGTKFVGLYYLFRLKSTPTVCANFFILCNGNV